MTQTHTGTRPAPPDRVRDLATRQQLGQHLDSRSTGLAASFVTSLVVALGWFAAAGALGGIVYLVRVRALAVLMIVCIVFGMAAVGFAFYRLARGVRVAHLYDHGVVWTVNGTPSAAGWAEFDRLVLLGATGRPTGGRLVTLDGRTVEVGVQGEAGEDAFLTALTARLRAHGRPAVIAADLPAAMESSVVDPAGGLVKLIVFSAVVGGVAIAFGLDKGAGLPLGAALALAAGIVTLGGYALAAVTGDPGLARLAHIGLGTVGLVLLITAVHVLSGINGFVVAVGALAVEGVLAAAGLVLVRRLPAPRRLGARRRLAARRGWTFAEQATVPVSGTESAARLIGVPTGATAVTGHAVLSGTTAGAGGPREVLAFDLLRRPARIGDEVQAVWMVRLPFVLPTLTQRDVQALTGDDAPARERLAADPVRAEVARLVGAGPVLGRFSVLALMRHWWIEGGWLHVIASGTPRASQVGERADELSRLVDALPLAELYRFARQG